MRDQGFIPAAGCLKDLKFTYCSVSLFPRLLNGGGRGDDNDTDLKTLDQSPCNTKDLI